MFGNRRRRGSSNPPLNSANANPSAVSAAAQVFMKSQASNAALSAAAAAAAIRSRPTTPINVADVQTKRMIRRSGSTSSVGSSTAGSSRPTLERRGSSGSMSERTFRDPSPARPVPSAVDAPPVPAIPNNIKQSAHRRTASLEAPPMRLASPPPNKTSGRGSSLGPGITTTPPRRNGQRVSSLSNVQELTDRPGSRGSVNFSYPMSLSSRPTSPVSQRQLTSPSFSRTNTPRITSSTNQNMVYDPNTRSFLPLAEILAIEQRIQDAANRPVKKKKRIAPQQATGTHLADGTIGGRPRGTAVDAMEEAARTTRAAEPPARITSPAPKSAPANVPAPPPAPAVITTPNSTPKKKKKKVVMTSDSDSDQGSYTLNSSDNDSDFKSAFNTRAGAMLAKKPSIVHEDREREEEEDTPKPKDVQSGSNLDTETRTTSPTPLPHSIAGRGHGRGQASASVAYAQGRQHTRSASQPAPGLPASTTSNEGRLGAKGSIRGGRVQSVSPARTAHFVTTLDTLQVKHQPPPRSISPRKSALKHPSSDSPRGQSPIGDIPGSWGPSNRQSISEASNASDETPVPRKKAVRVSFDESNVMVGEAAPQLSTDSPIVASPQQAKRNWFSLGSRGKKQDAVIEDDEIMKPRPALPSFGSVRERKNTREPEERQLVKPVEFVEVAEPVTTTPAAPADVPISSPSPSTLFTSPTGEFIEYPMGQSNDHVVGTILSQDAASKNAANISKSREPLPPQVLSVEGSGYHSDSDSTLSGLDTSEIGVSKAAETTSKVTAGQSEDEKALFDDDDEDDGSTTPMNGAVPEIAITQPTPNLETTDQRKEWPDIPGGFPSGSTSSESGSQVEEGSPTIVEHHVTDPTLSAIGIAEPYEGPEPGSPVLGAIAEENHLRDATIYEETEDESIYSDAAEDLSDIEGDGFMSLDAVVDSPVVASSVPGLAISTPPDSPTARSTKERAYMKSQLSRKSSEPDMDEGWEKAQDYWRGLSADKKHQLEQEAREEAEESDATVDAKPLPRPKKKKKKVAVKPAPVHVIPIQPTGPPRHAHRTGYMIQPGSKAEQDGYTPVMRSSMRQEPLDTPVETHIRMSMRGQGSMRGSMRGNEADSKGALQKKHRPVSLPASQITSDPAAVKTHIRALSAASAAAAQRNLANQGPTLQRKNSGDSDSSFKRIKPAGESRFKSSMRRGSNDHTVNGRQQSPMQSSRFSLRSMSPTGSTTGRRPFSTTTQPLTPTHMRSSMRSSFDSAPTLRGSKPDRAKSPIRIPGFGRSSSTKPTKGNQAPRSGSRFADSSDEEDVRPSFRSRFVDSSDDDEDVALPKTTGMRGSMRASQPVRGIPRRAGVDDGDSSDLPDSSDEQRSPTSPGMKLAKNRPNGNTNTSQGLTLASGSLRRSGSGRGALATPTTTPVTRPTQSRRGGLMSIFRKKADPSSKVRKIDIESAARRDTPLERSRSDLQAVKRQESYQSTNGASPKLQKRNTAERLNSASWPLPASTTTTVVGGGGEDGRPFSADAADGIAGGELTNGNGEVGRPELGTRRFTATGVGDVDLSTVTGKGRKKKKFHALRKMFRLDD